MNVAIIPARAGSKRIPEKNIRPFCGKPIIAYAIQTARDSGLFDRIIVSTESDKIARVATGWGAEVPFRRPAELATDFATTTDVILHAVQWLKEKWWLRLRLLYLSHLTAPHAPVSPPGI